MLFCARFRAFCSLLPRQAGTGKNRHLLLPYGLRRLQKGREELYYVLFSSEKAEMGGMYHMWYQRIQTCILEIHA